MLRSFIVGVFENSIEIILWIILLICLGAGWLTNGIVGMIIFLIVGIVFEIVFFGTLLVVFDIRNNIRKIRDEIETYNRNK